MPLLIDAATAFASRTDTLDVSCRQKPWLEASLPHGSCLENLNQEVGDDPTSCLYKEKLQERIYCVSNEMPYYYKLNFIKNTICFSDIIKHQKELFWFTVL